MAHIEAEFRNGALHPTTPLDLRPGEKVEIIVLRKSDLPSRSVPVTPAIAEISGEDLAAWADELDTLDLP